MFLFYKTWSNAGSNVRPLNKQRKEKKNLQLRNEGLVEVEKKKKLSRSRYLFKKKKKYLKRVAFECVPWIYMSNDPACAFGDSALGFQKTNDIRADEFILIARWTSFNEFNVVVRWSYIDSLVHRVFIVVLPVVSGLCPWNIVLVSAFSRRIVLPSFSHFNRKIFWPFLQIDADSFETVYFKFFFFFIFLCELETRLKFEDIRAIVFFF